MGQPQITFDTVNAGWPKVRLRAAMTGAVGSFALQQMVPTRPTEEHFPGRGYVQAFGHRFPGPNSFGVAHTILTQFSSKCGSCIPPSESSRERGAANTFKIR